MKRFISNNKEILIALFCIWIGIIFTLIFIRLSNIEKKLNNIDSSIMYLDNNLGELDNISDLNYLKDIYDVMISNYRQDRLKDLGF